MASLLQDTQDVVALNYVVSLKHNGTIYGWSPIASVLADVYMKSPAILTHMLQDEQRRQARSTYVSTDLFSRWPREYVRAKDIAGDLRDAIKHHEKTYSLFDNYRGEIFEDVRLMSRGVSGKVKSKSGEGFRPAAIHNVFLDSSGRPHPRTIHCGCPNFSIKATMSGAADEEYRIEDLHVQLLRDFVDRALEYPQVMRSLGNGHEVFARSGNQPQQPVFQPFQFSRNWRYLSFSDSKSSTGISRHVTPLYPSLASQECATLLHYYLGEKNQASLNHILLSQPDIYSPVLLEELRRGNLRFRVIRNGTKKRDISPEDARLREEMNTQVAHELGRRGYKHRGYSSVEGFVATRYEKYHDVFEVVFPSDPQMRAFYVHKRLPKIQADVSVIAAPEPQRHVIAQGAKLTLNDDFTKTRNVPAEIGGLHAITISSSDVIAIKMPPGIADLNQKQPMSLA